MSATGRLLRAAPLRLIPLVTIVIGVVGAGVYWLAAQVWPTSVAVVLSLLATNLLGKNLLATKLLDARGRDGTSISSVFALLIEYNALMALSAATGPFPLPAYLTLGLIMISAHAVSGALVVSCLVGEQRVTSGDLALALVVGLAPATLLGIPGLIGLGAAIVARMLLGLWGRGDLTQRVSEISFYLGALATWKFV